MVVALVIRRAEFGADRSRGLPNQVAQRVNAVRRAVDAEDWESTGVALRHMADELDLQPQPPVRKG
jgi:hypothetical protein